MTLRVVGFKALIWRKCHLRIKAFFYRPLPLYLVHLVLIVLIPAATETILIESSETEEMMITVRPVGSISTDMTPNEYKFTTNLLMSRCYFNQENATCVLTISEGTLLWTLNYSDVDIFDNLDNHFTPVVMNDSVSNPCARIAVPPCFNYKISLSVETQVVVGFDGESGAYCLGFGIRPALPTNLTVRFPSNFTVLECNPDVKGGREHEFLTLNWHIEPHQTFNLFVRFLPFCPQATMRSLIYTSDFPTVFPIRGFIRATWEEAFETPARFSIWEITPFLAMPLSFPLGGQNVSIEKVYDGSGICEEIFEPVEKPDNSTLGYYFVDNENRKVIVYPRYHYKGDFYTFKVAATFVYPNIRSERSFLEGLRDTFLPFRYEFSMTISEVSVPINWKQNITGNVEIRFLLPPGAEPQAFESGNPIVSTEDGRPVARFVYNSPKTLHPGKWTVVCHIISPRNFLALQVVSLIILFSMFATIQKLPKQLVPLLNTLASSGIFIYNFHSFLELGAFKPLFALLIVGQSVLLLLIVVASIRKFQDKPFSLRSVLYRFFQLVRKKLTSATTACRRLINRKP